MAENNRMGKMRDISRKLEIPREQFMQRWAQSKTETEAEGIKKMWQEYTEELYKKDVLFILGDWNA